MSVFCLSLWRDRKLFNKQTNIVELKINKRYLPQFAWTYLQKYIFSGNQRLPYRLLHIYSFLSNSYNSSNGPLGCTFSWSFTLPFTFTIQHQLLLFSTFLGTPLVPNAMLCFIVLNAAISSSLHVVRWHQLTFLVPPIAIRGKRIPSIGASIELYRFCLTTSYRHSQDLLFRS